MTPHLFLDTGVMSNALAKSSTRLQLLASAGASIICRGVAQNPIPCVEQADPQARGSHHYS